jgi:hypothetical protein
MSHFEDTQVRGKEQTMPQAPQLFGSILVSAQAAPHFSVPPEQTMSHLPEAQACPDGQAFPQRPQLLLSTAVSTQASPHFSVLPVQTTSHLPSEHTCPVVQALPHAPQLALSFDTSRQLPLHMTRGDEQVEASKLPESGASRVESTPDSWISAALSSESMALSMAESGADVSGRSSDPVEAPEQADRQIMPNPRLIHLLVRRATALKPK